MANGEDSGTWGTYTNTNWNLMEAAVAGVITVTMSNANYTLSNLNGVTDEARNMVLIINGTTGGAGKQVVAPLVTKIYVITNSTTDGYSVNIGASSGAVITIPNGVTAQVYCDGVNFYSAQTGSAGNFTVNGSLTATGISDTGTLVVNGNLTAYGTSAITTLQVGTSGTAPTPASSDNSTAIATTAYVKNNLSGLGTMSTQNANNVAITGGTINGVSGSNPSMSVGTATNATNATNATTASNANAVFGKTQLGLGITGEIWHGVSKGANVTYTNTFGYPIMVIVCWACPGGAGSINIIVDGSTNIMAQGDSSNSYNSSFIVTPGSTYIAVASGSASLYQWSELY